MNTLKTTILLILASCFMNSYSQTYYFFQDSPDNEYYDASWMNFSSPSDLEKNHGDKFPVETTILPQQGLNSLRLKWKSVTGGNWSAFVAAIGWTNYDISDTDTLQFYLRSESLFTVADLPKIFLEDINNKKTDLHLISDWTDDLQAGIWTKIKISMDQFFDANDGTDFTQIKTIGFTQNAADGVEHTLYIDDMRVYKGGGTAAQATKPTGLSAKGYDSHIELSWDFNPENDLQGYRIEKSDDGGENFTMAGLVNSNSNYYVDWLGDQGENASASYQIRAINFNDEPSEASEIVSATTQTLNDDELLDMVQEYTFRYFWDFGHETSGLTRERNTSGNTVTSGGTGFGLMTIPVGIERGFITREEGAERILKMLTFLEGADRFHGAWSHWLNGNSGNVIPFSPNDNGGDIVETSFVAQGLLTIRQYFTDTNATEEAIVAKATTLWEEIEWDWYRRDGSESIYWHWSPDKSWDMNMKVRGWNEAAIVYLCAIASPTHGVPASLWETGWAGGNYAIPRTLYGKDLYVGSGFGGPLFFAHYSFLGFDPSNIADNYANYFMQNRNHSLVQQAYCKANTYGHTGYSEECWGLTASDDPDGYMAHEPGSTRDNGTITPTAALSSMPYTPEASMLALKHFYRNMGDKVWGMMGFKDAFNEDRNWYADSYLAIDQGPIILMIENYRTQLLWDLFMSNSEIQPMLDAIGFVDSPNSTEEMILEEEFSVYPNPAAEMIQVQYPGMKSITISNIIGQTVRSVVSESNYIEKVPVSDLKAGVYFVTLDTDDGQVSSKFVKE